MTMQSALPKTIYAIQHLAFEDLGSFEDIFYQLGYRVRYFEAGVDNLTQALSYEGLTIILGGPIGVYESEDYPFLKDELHLLKERLKNKLPTLGICLGAQLIASALGANVYAGHIKEIGWSQLTLSSIKPNILTPIKDIPVLHWHGDTFDLPENAILLASSEHYPNQAFQLGQNIIGLQFHPEVLKDSLEKWLIGHTCELRNANINIQDLRRDNQLFSAQLEQASAELLTNFMHQIGLTD